MSASLRIPANAIFNWGTRTEDKSSVNQARCTKSDSRKQVYSEPEHLKLPCLLHVTAFKVRELHVTFIMPCKVLNTSLWIFLVATEAEEQMIRKGSPIFPKSSPPRQKIPHLFPEPVQSQTLRFWCSESGLCVALSSISILSSIRVAQVKILNHSLSRAVALKGLQLLSETHLGLISKTRVDSSRWTCSLQWTSQPHCNPYIPSLQRNMMHRLCNTDTVKAVGRKMCPVDRAVLFMCT